MGPRQLDGRAAVGVDVEAKRRRQRAAGVRVIVGALTAIGAR
jgi:hypothetical protein